MLETESRDFSYYSHEFKDNYRKGVHRLRAILSAPLTARQFAANRGGVAVVLGTPEGKEDRNSAELRDILLHSGVVDQAVESWLHGFYEFPAGGWDHLLSAAETCRELANSTFLFRSVSASPIGMGKLAATLAGLNPADYADMTALASSSTAMAAVAASQTAMTAVASSQTAMTAVASSQTAMTAVAASTTACQAIEVSSTAKTALFSSPLAQTITGITATNSWANRRSGKVWLIWHRQSWSNGGSTIQVRYTVVGNQTVSHTADQTYNKDCRVDRFMKGIENYASAGGIGNVVSYRFIPC